MSLPTNSGMQRVITCDEDGAPTGTAGRIEAHEGEGILHKAFSVFVFRNAGSEVLLQRRSPQKALFALHWANTCCSHPAPDDGPLPRVAERRLQEELGFSVPVREAGSFVYRAKDPHVDLSEYEHDTVLVGELSAGILIRPDPAEIAGWGWTPVAVLQRDLLARPERYAPWLAAGLKIASAAAGKSLGAV